MIFIHTYTVELIQKVYIYIYCRYIYVGTGFINAPVATLSIFVSLLIYGILFEVSVLRATAGNFVVVAEFLSLQNSKSSYRCGITYWLLSVTFK